MDKKVLSTLPTVNVPKPTYGRIVRVDNLGEWRFMVMPIQISTSVRANYRASGGIGVIQSQQFMDYSEELRIPALNFSTKYDNKDLRPYIDSFKNLALPIEGLFSPPVVAFSWGEDTFSPCVITSVSVTESDWFSNGSLATCTMAITLLKVAESQQTTV